ncbi:MAG: translational GTPase TypA, partial [Desulfobacterales bacterium]|nr:translational GTPase TypA [Desulfobacterales bacterium]
MKETLRTVAIRVEDTDSQERLIVKGRSEFQMAILIETMRREGFELCVGRPEVIYKEKNGKRQEPMEHVFVDCDEPFVGVVTEKLTHRKARLSNMVNKGTGRVRIEFIMPSRGLIGYREEFLIDTKGTGILNSYFSGYDDYMGNFPSRYTGSLVSDRQGKAVAYALFKLEPRGQLFVVPNDPVYEGMVVGEYNREVDLNVNPCKEKKLTNIRASGKDDAVVLTPVMGMTLERAIHFIKADEMVEVTPLSIRLRKTILTAHNRPVGKGPIH